MGGKKEIWLILFVDQYSWIFVNGIFIIISEMYIILFESCHLLHWWFKFFLHIIICFYIFLNFFIKTKPFFFSILISKSIFWSLIFYLYYILHNLYLIYIFFCFSFIFTIINFTVTIYYSDFPSFWNNYFIRSLLLIFL